MRRAAAMFVLAGLASVPLTAQGRGRDGDRAQGIPPGHLPPAGECRVWYDGRPPGHQPPPTSCREAERVASRDRSARGIYGSDRGGQDPWWDPNGDGRDRERPRAIPRPGPSRYPSRIRGIQTAGTHRASVMRTHAVDTATRPWHSTTGTTTATTRVAKTPETMTLTTCSATVVTDPPIAATIGATAPKRNTRMSIGRVSAPGTARAIVTRTCPAPLNGAAAFGCRGHSKRRTR
jgi:hypothetical protein